jgi:6-phosphogluconolactonase
MDLRIFPHRDVLSHEVARAIVDRIHESLATADRCALCLAGGETPRALYRVLATEERDRIPWPRLHLFWGDERFVPQDDPRSNYRLVRESLLDHVPIPPQNVHPPPTDLPDPELAARVYEQTLRRWFPTSWPRFDLILLGLGADGHTASLFPGTPFTAEQIRWVAPACAPADPRLRLTLTLPVLNHASLVFFLVTGTEKADILRRVLTDPSAPTRYPAAAVRPEGGGVAWWVDENAAASVPRQTPRAPGD